MEDEVKAEVEKPKMIRRNVYQIMIDSMIELRDGKASNNHKLERAAHPEVGGEEFDAFIGHLNKLCESERDSKKSIFKKTLASFNQMTDDEKAKFIEMLKNNGF